MTAIQWTDETWNPTVGCSRVSPGCDNCYAIKVAAREMQDAHRGLTKDGDWTGEVRLLPDRLDTPLKWRKPRRVFVDSMSDLFHPEVPVDFIYDVWATMAACPQHTFQILTKRPQHMARIVGSMDWPVLPNVWLGTSVENQQYANLRIPHLLVTPAAVRFLSVEPLLGPVDLHQSVAIMGPNDAGIDWVIVGGESGRGARPMNVEWAAEVIDQCRAADVAVFVKQLGAVWAKTNGAADRKGGDLDEWPDNLRLREYPA